MPGSSPPPPAPPPQEVVCKISNSKNDEDGKKSEFLCGVVEGFYGRPWTTEQRKDLFSKMQAWGTNSYLYAPKDDCKHRAYWREPYTVEEAEHLQSLIALASECNIDFYYAISPGLDITYSNGKEMACLKRKLEQVAQLGCKAFALLFDDIEPEMCKQDKEVFQSFAHAQVTVTNDIFQHLGQPKFLFCPTQYCTARAVPSVRNSEYLNTIGSKLAPEIKIMWTGDKVISKVISSQSLEDITEVLRRPCLIWDNEHANDYDQKRVFLGPYSGRSPEIIGKVSGVLSNPNCEFGANFVAIHTLAQWSRCTVDGTLPLTSNIEAVSADIKLENESGEGPDVAASPLPPHVYHPKNALINALNDWAAEFSRQKTVWGPMSKPQVGLSQPSIIPGVTTCITTTVTTAGMPPMPVNGAITTDGLVTTTTTTSATLTPTLSASADAVLPPVVAPPGVPNASALQPIAMPVMNSLVSTNKVVLDSNLDADTLMAPALPAALEQPKLSTSPSSGGTPIVKNAPPLPVDLPRVVADTPYMEPMDCLPTTSAVPGPEGQAAKLSDIPMESVTNPPTPASAMQVEPDSNLHKSESSTMLYESAHDDSGSSGKSPLVGVAGHASESNMLCDTNPPSPMAATTSKDDDPEHINTKDLMLLVQLFYLPAEHGQAGHDLLNDFYWLKCNANAMLSPGVPGAGSKEDRMEWERRAHKFDTLVRCIQDLFVKLCTCQNRELVYDLYTYLWDMCGVIQTLNGFVQWLSKGSCSPKFQNFVVGQQTWFSGMREAFMSGDHEPWMFRGGLISDLLRLLPLDSGHDLYIYRYPEVPASVLYLVRPYQAKDEAAVYGLAATAYEEDIDAPMGLCPSDRHLVGDVMVGAYLTLVPEFCFVCESSSDGSIVGFAVTAPDAKAFHSRYNVAWLPEMRLKYPLKKPLVPTDDCLLTPIEEMAHSFHQDDGIKMMPIGLAVDEENSNASNDKPPNLPWGVLKTRVSTRVQESSLAKRLTMLSFACLRATGTIRAYVEVPVGEMRQKDHYVSLGFAVVNAAANSPTSTDTGSDDKLICMTRSF